jgi:hypothetical protein
MEAAMKLEALVKHFGKWPAFVLLVLATVMPLLVALLTIWR